MVAMAVLLVVAVLTVGIIIFFRLHTLPERMAHKSHKIQFEIVAVLGLLALFTHIHLFWVAGLLLALIEFPDFSCLFGRMAHALERIAGSAPRGGGSPVEPPRPLNSRTKPVEPAPKGHAEQKEPSHA